jgi:prepilin-type N-terminal cleavage/methylation domain-containing protein
MKGRRGFTYLELITVLAVGGILTAIVIGSFSRVHGQMGVRSAQATFLSLHAQARVSAVELGAVVRLMVDEQEARVWLETGPLDAPGVMTTVDFAQEFDVTIRTGAGDVAFLCMTPRGFADPTCNNFEGTLNVAFSRGGRTSRVEVLPLGRAREVEE